MLSLFQITLLTKNLNLLKDFYTDTLGLKLTYEDSSQTKVKMEAGNAMLVLVKVAQHPSTNARIGLLAENMKAFRQELILKNINVTPVKVKEGKFFFELKDPDGNELFIYEPLFTV